MKTQQVERLICGQDDAYRVVAMQSDEDHDWRLKLESLSGLACADVARDLSFSSPDTALAVGSELVSYLEIATLRTDVHPITEHLDKGQNAALSAVLDLLGYRVTWQAQRIAELEGIAEFAADCVGQWESLYDQQTARANVLTATYRSATKEWADERRRRIVAEAQLTTEHVALEQAEELTHVLEQEIASVTPLIQDGTRRLVSAAQQIERLEAERDHHLSRIDQLEARIVELSGGRLREY